MIELSFSAKPDEHGVINGLDLARALIAQACRLINPYVNECPACLDDVFGALANDELERMHDLLKEGAPYAETTAIFAVGPEESRDNGIALHLAGAHAQVIRLLGVPDHHHH